MAHRPSQPEKSSGTNANLRQNELDALHGRLTSQQLTVLGDLVALLQSLGVDTMQTLLDQGGGFSRPMIPTTAVTPR